MNFQAPSFSVNAHSHFAFTKNEVVLGETALSCTLSTERKGNPTPEFPWQRTSISVPSNMATLSPWKAGNTCREVAFGQSSSLHIARVTYFIIRANNSNPSFPSLWVQLGPHLQQ